MDIVRRDETYQHELMRNVMRWVCSSHFCVLQASSCAWQRPNSDQERLVHTGVLLSPDCLVSISTWKHGCGAPVLDKKISAIIQACNWAVCDSVADVLHARRPASIVPGCSLAGPASRIRLPEPISGSERSPSITGRRFATTG